MDGKYPTSQTPQIDLSFCDRFILRFDKYKVLRVLSTKFTQYNAEWRYTYIIYVQKEVDKAGEVGL